MFLIQYYPLLCFDCEKPEMKPLMVTKNKEDLKRHKAYLEEVIENAYRLCVLDSSISYRKNYTIQCPHCASKLKRIGNNCTNNRFSIYQCDYCTKGDKKEC